MLNYRPYGKDIHRLVASTSSEVSQSSVCPIEFGIGLVLVTSESCTLPRQYQAAAHHRFLKHASIPDLPKNQRQPKKRTKERTAVAHSKAWKKRAVREVALDYIDS